MFIGPLNGIVLFAALLVTEPCLVFHLSGPVQPTYVDGVPSWRDTLEVGRRSVVVRQLIQSGFDSSLMASLQASGDYLIIWLIRVPLTDSPNPFKGASSRAAYEARISGLKSGAYNLEVRLVRPGVSDTITFQRRVHIP
jgi:hypothetical protein